MFVIPVPTAKYYKEMLAHCKAMLEYQNGMVAIHPRFNKLITSLNASARYAADTQSQVNSNECHNGTSCAINSPQTQGDGSASSPTNLQVSKTNEVEEQEAPPAGHPGDVLFTLLAFDCKIDLTLEQRPIFCIVVDPATFKGELRCVPLMPAGDVAVCVIFIEEDHFSVTSPCELPMIQIQGQSVKCFSRFF